MLATLLLVIAQDPPAAFTERDLRFVLSMSPLPAPPASPTNVWADSPAAAELGRKLFFDPRLSKDGMTSCASCHAPETAWCDQRPQAVGAEPDGKNTPTILGAAHQRWLFWNGRADSLWSQALKPIESEREMASARTVVLRHIVDDAELSAMWRGTFGEPIDVSRASLEVDALPPPIDPAHPFEPRATGDPRHAAWLAIPPAERERIDGAFAKVGKAIEAFERTVASGASDFDRFVAGLRSGDDEKIAALSPAAMRGLDLFVDKAGCVSCHFGPTFSDGQFHNLGLASTLLEEGRPDGIRAVRVDPFNGRGAHSDANDWSANQKLLYLPSDEHVLGAFKTPSLRNVALTAPYMHDGRFASLADVVRYYSELPGGPSIGHREETLKPLELGESEIADLVEYLESLTGRTE